MAEEKALELKLGIKESKELLHGLLELSMCLLDVFKDGVQAADAIELFNKITSDEKIKEKFFAAFDGYKHLPAEIKDLDAYESVELIAELIAFVPKFLDALKDKPEA